MEIGKRVPVPGIFKFMEVYTEMRKVGTYPNVLPYAVVLAYLEAVSDVPAHQTEIVLQTILASEVFQYPKTLRTSAEVSAHLESQAFSSLFQSKCTEVFARFQIDTVTDSTLSNIDRLCTKLNLRVQLQLGEMRQGIGPSSTTVVGIGVSQHTCFVLYRRRTRESFVILPCGHVQVRHSLMEIVGRNIGQRALSPWEQLSVEICSDCGAGYSPDVYPLLKPTSDGGWSVTVSPQLPQYSTQSFVCSLCFRGIPKEALCCACTCSNTLCFDCAVIERISSEHANCPLCHSALVNPAALNVGISALANVKNALPKDWVMTKPKGRVDPLVKKCFCCGKVLELKQFVGKGMHLNCWVCGECKATGGGKCPRCGGE